MTGANTITNGRALVLKAAAVLNVANPNQYKGITVPSLMGVPLVRCNSKKYAPKISHKGAEITEDTEKEKTEESGIMNYFFPPCFFVRLCVLREKYYWIF